MKKRSMILALASMLGISAAATAVSGFAWFTSQRTATINQSVYKVGAAEGSLEISLPADAEYYNCAPNIATNTPTVLTVNPTDKALADVSSKDGVAFTKVKFDVNNDVAGVLTEAKPESGHDWTSQANSQQAVCVTWQLNVKNTGSEDTAMDVFLSVNGALFQNNGATNDYSKYFRMSIFDGSKNVFTYSAYEKDAENKESYNRYLESTTVGENTLRGDKALAATDYMTGDLGLIVDKSSAKYVAGEAAANNQKLIGGLEGDDSVTLTFTVWCEGTSTPESECLANSVKTSMSLVGVNAR